METRASPFVVGLFTLAVLAGVLAFVFWLGRYGEAAGRDQYRVVFSDEVTGLNRGSSVLFNGIKVGDVVNLTLAPDDPSQVVALITVDSNVPVRVDTRAQLQFQGITGVGFVQLRAGSHDSPSLRETWGDNAEPPIIYAERSTFQDLMEGGQSLLTKLDEVATNINTLIANNEAAVTSTISNVEQFTTALAENSDNVASFLADAGTAARRLDEVGQRIDTLAQNLNAMIEGVEPGAVAEAVNDLSSFAQRIDGVAERIDGVIAANESAFSATIANAERFSTMLADNSDQVASLLTDAGAAARRLDEVGQRIDELAQNFNEVVDAVEPDSVRQIVADVRAFSETMASNSENITRLANNAGDAAERISALAERLDGVTQDVARVVSAVEPDAIARSVANVEAFTNTLAERRPDFDRFIDDAGAVASQLRVTSQRLDQLLARVDNMVGQEGDSFIGDISAAARSFRELSDNLNSRLDVITADIQRFGGGGLREFQLFMSEGRRTLGNIERVIGNLERNPSRFLFGGSDVREYTPGRRF